jgi:hypothetical protein
VVPRIGRRGLLRLVGRQRRHDPLLLPCLCALLPTVAARCGLGGLTVAVSREGGAGIRGRTVSSAGTRARARSHARTPLLCSITWNKGQDTCMSMNLCDARTYEVLHSSHCIEHAHPLSKLSSEFCSV